MAAQYHCGFPEQLRPVRMGQSSRLAPLMGNQRCFSFGGVGQSFIDWTSCRSDAGSEEIRQSWVWLVQFWSGANGRVAI